MGWLLWAVTDSQTARDCIHDRKANQPYQALHKDSGFIIVTVTRAKLHIACGFVAAGENEGALTGLSGIAVALFTGTLWWITRRSVKATEVAAYAAEKSAGVAEQALTDYERPWIFRGPLHMEWRGTLNVQFNDWWISLKWKNVGRTPALIQHFHYRFIDIEQLPDTPDYSQMAEFGVIPTLAPGDDFETQKVGVAGGFRVDGHPVEYVVFGRLIYAEMNGRQHTSGFAFRLATIGNGALEHGGNPYNYYT